MIQPSFSLRWRIALGVAAVLVLIIGYALLATKVDSKTIPTPGQMWDAFTRSMTPRSPTESAWLWADLWATGQRLFAGLAVGVVLAVILGIAMGCYGAIESVLLPPLSFLAKIPPTAMIAIFLVAFGLTFNMYVGMIGFGILPTLTQAVYLAAKEDVPEELLHKAQTLGASSAEVIGNIVWPTALPRVLDAVRLQVGPAMVYLIAAEMLFADIGFGYRIRLQQRLLDMSTVYDYLIVLGAAGFAIDLCLKLARRWFSPWYGT